MWNALLTAIGRYRDHPDPRTKIANTVALVIVSNQPFYPLYLYWAVSPAIGPSFLTWLSTPLFAAVPFAARRNALLGRCLMLVAGLGNTVICLLAFGTASGVGVFLFPCLVLSMVLFRAQERVYALVFAALCFASVFLRLDGIAGPLHRYDLQEYAAFQQLNFISAASLTALIGWLCSDAFGPSASDR